MVRLSPPISTSPVAIVVLRLNRATAAATKGPEIAAVSAKAAASCPRWRPAWRDHAPTPPDARHSQRLPCPWRRLRRGGRQCVLSMKASILSKPSRCTGGGAKTVFGRSVSAGLACWPRHASHDLPHHAHAPKRGSVASE